jgi:hypothetical protein
MRDAQERSQRSARILARGLLDAESRTSCGYDLNVM